MPSAHAGNAEGVIVMVKRIVDAKARFRSLAKPRADTGTGRLMTVIRLAMASAIIGSLLHCRRRLDRVGVLV